MSTRKPKPKRTVPPALVSQIMQEMGRKGGKIGGKRKAAKLTLEQHQDWAKKAARTRWDKKKKDQQ